MNAAKKQSETATILRAGRSAGATHNSAAKHAGAKDTDAKAYRFMVNLPPQFRVALEAATERQMMSLSKFAVMAMLEKMRREGDLEK